MTKTETDSPKATSTSSTAFEIKIGPLALRTGVSVRTLHHYDEIGLLSPALRTSSGHRLYGGSDVERLQRIVALRQLGLSLDDICACLDRPDLAPRRLVAMQLDRLRAELAEQTRLLTRLEGVARRLDDDASVEALLEAIEMTTEIDKYYTPEQRQMLAARADEVGPDAMREAEQAWHTLFDELRAAMARGDDPGSEAVQVLAGRADRLVQAFTGGDPGITASLSKMYEDDPVTPARYGMPVDEGLMTYYGNAASIFRDRRDRDSGS